MELLQNVIRTLARVMNYNINDTHVILQYLYHVPSARMNEKIKSES